MNRIVLAYSGGLESSVAIPWLAGKYSAEIAAVTLDLGQGRELDDVRERALGIGAPRAHVIDAREEFARDFILPALQACAIYEGGSPLATALGRPLIARHLVEMAHVEGTTTIAHTGSGEGNDHVRLEALIRALEPSFTVLAPALEWDMTPDEVTRYARQRGIPVSPSSDNAFSVDVNLWGRSIAAGTLDDPWVEPPEAIYLLTRGPGDTPDQPAYVEISFEQGVPVRINGVALSLVELITSLETIAGAHGVGRIDMVENRLVGLKSREAYESPAAVALHTAHKELQRFVMPRDLERLSSELGVKYADLVYNGHWYSRAREALDAFVSKVQERVTGTIRLKFFKGDCRVVGRTSPFSADRLDPMAGNAARRPSALTKD
jgi:argininosuccinate synthase